jgi:hypothetical protein
MPWLTIIVALFTFFASKKSGASTGQALGLSALAGGATYAASHYTDWGKANLGEFDGVAPITVDDAANPSSPPLVTSPGSGGGSVGLNTSGLGAIMPIAAGAVAGAAATSAFPSWLWWVGGGLLAFALLR